MVLKLSFRPTLSVLTVSKTQALIRISTGDLYETLNEERSTVDGGGGGQI